LKYSTNILRVLLLLIAIALPPLVLGQIEEQSKLPEPILNAKSPLFISTYDKADQLNHPDVIYVKNGWNSYKYWMAFTPYPYENRKHENPSIRASNDGIHWGKPLELMTDPIVPPPSDILYGGFNSDPDIVLAGKSMYLFYRTTTKDKVTTTYFKISDDGVKWSAPYITDLSTTTTSPAMYYDGEKFHCWFVEYTGRGKEPYAIKYCSSEDGKTWSTPKSVTLVVPGYTPWHLNVTRTDDGYEMLLTAYQLNTNNGHTVLFHAWSLDGIEWHLSSPEPLLKPVKDSWDSKQIYRSTMVKDNSGYKIWYSAADINDKWGIGYITLKKHFWDEKSGN
jgi:predicted GH43/DUF377 family glycosyl hydrolase